MIGELSFNDVCWRLAAMNGFSAILRNACDNTTAHSHLIRLRGWPMVYPGVTGDTVFKPASSAISSDVAKRFYERFSTPPPIDSRLSPGHAKVTSDRVTSPAIRFIEVHSAPPDVGIENDNRTSVNVVFADPQHEDLLLSPGRTNLGIHFFRLHCPRHTLSCSVSGAPSGIGSALADTQQGTNPEIARNDTEFRDLTLSPAICAIEPITIPPDKMLHDGGYRFEKDGNNQWLWTGPDPHFRVLVGFVPVRPVNLSMILVSEGEAGNSEKLRVNLNGVPQRLRFEAWGGGSGRLSVELTQETANPVVLSVAIPRTREIGMDTRRLGLCLGPIEISRGAT